MSTETVYPISLSLQIKEQPGVLCFETRNESETDVRSDPDRKGKEGRGAECWERGGGKWWMWRSQFLCPFSFFRWAPTMFVFLAEQKEAERKGGKVRGKGHRLHASLVFFFVFFLVLSMLRWSKGREERRRQKEGNAGTAREKQLSS